MAFRLQLETLARQQGDRLLGARGTIGPEESLKHSWGRWPLRSTVDGHIDRPVRINDRVALVLAASKLAAIRPEASYTFWRFTGIMRIRSCERGYTWKPESSAAERSSGSLY